MGLLLFVVPASIFFCIILFPSNGMLFSLTWDAGVLLCYQRVEGGNKVESTFLKEKQCFFVMDVTMDTRKFSQQNGLNYV